MRRLHVPALHSGHVTLTSNQLHHIHTVLRLTDGTTVELFDDAGQTAIGQLHTDGVDVVECVAPERSARSLTIAAAVPKGERADWMVEKLSELGVAAFVPLAAERSVVLPQGQGKHQRWQRIAIESAKQSHRPGVMQIASLTPPLDPSLTISAAFLSTTADAMPLQRFLNDTNSTVPLLLYVGPEGGWTDREVAAFTAAGLTAIKLTDTILRIETAAVAAAAIVLAATRPTNSPSTSSSAESPTS